MKFPFFGFRQFSVWFGLNSWNSSPTGFIGLKTSLTFAMVVVLNAGVSQKDPKCVEPSEQWENLWLFGVYIGDEIYEILPSYMGLYIS